MPDPSADAGIASRFGSTLSLTDSPGAGAESAAARRYTVGSITLDVEIHRVSVDDREVAVSLLEMQLLLHLARAQGAPVLERSVFARIPGAGRWATAQRPRSRSRWRSG